MSLEHSNRSTDMKKSSNQCLQVIFFHREFIPTQSIQYRSRMIFLDMEWTQNIYFPSTLF